MVDMGGLPVRTEPAQLLDFVVEKVLLRGRQARLRIGKQLVPVGPAGEQLALPPDRASLQRIALGIGHGRQQASVDLENRRANPALAQSAHAQEQYEYAQQCSGERNHQEQPIHSASYGFPLLTGAWIRQRPRLRRPANILVRSYGTTILACLTARRLGARWGVWPCPA